MAPRKIVQRDDVQYRMYEKSIHVLAKRGGVLVYFGHEVNGNDVNRLEELIEIGRKLEQERVSDVLKGLIR